MLFDDTAFSPEIRRVWHLVDGTFDLSFYLIGSTFELADGFANALRELGHLVSPKQQKYDQQNQHHFSAAEIRQ